MTDTRDMEYGKHLQNLSVLAHNLKFNDNYITSLIFDEEERNFAVDILENVMAYMHKLYYKVEERGTGHGI